MLQHVRGKETVEAFEQRMTGFQVVDRVDELNSEAVCGIRSPSGGDLMRPDAETMGFQLIGPVAPGTTEIEQGISWPKPERGKQLDVDAVILRASAEICRGQLLKYGGVRQIGRETLLIRPIVVELVTFASA